MKRALFGAVLALLSVNCYAQFSISVSPYSHRAWGEVNGMTEISIGYEGSGFIQPLNFGMHYFHDNKNQYWVRAVKPDTHPDAVSLDGITVPPGNERFIQEYPPDQYEYLHTGFSNSTLALSYKPINIKDIFKAGMIVTPKGFPTSKSVKMNFWIEAGYSFKRFRISYAHISNGFGVRTPINLGVDFIRASYFFKSS